MRAIVVHIENFGNGLHSLLYVSRVSDTETVLIDTDIDSIVEISQRNNSALAVTGLLLAHAGYFIQVLEGSHATISALVGRIALDPRHTDLKVLATAPISQRAFGRWAMRAGRPPAETAVAGFDPYAMDPKALMALLSFSGVLATRRKAA